MGPKERLSFTIDPDIARKLDELADQLGESRSSIVEKAIEVYLREMDSLIESMTNPLMRALQSAMTSDPKVMRLMARMLSEHVTEEEAARIVDRAPFYREIGKRRQAEKKSKRLGGPNVEPA